MKNFFNYLKFIIIQYPKYLKTKFNLYFPIILGSILILGFIYVRLQKPTEINLKEFSLLRVLIIFFMLGLYGYLIYKQFKPTINPSKFTEFLISIKEYIFKSLKSAYEKFIFPYVFVKLRSLIIKIFLEYYDYSFVKKYMYLLYFICFIIPKLLISTSLLIDIIYFNKFNYFYKIFGILWIPILIQIFIFMLLNWGRTFKIVIEKDFLILPEYDENHNIDGLRLKLITERNNFPFTHEEYTVFAVIILYIEFFYNAYIQEGQKSWVKYTNIFIYLFFFISWAYRLILIFVK